MVRGKFITFEGGEGAGKSTQVELMAAALAGSGLEVLQTREPGGSPGAEQIRELLIHGDVERWDPWSEALLHFAARREHLQKTVLPALDKGTWVVSDRFSDSTMAYQGYGHGLGRGAIEQLYAMVVGTFRPDLTLILDVDIEQGLARAAKRAGGGDRYERMDRGFHERLRQGFREIAAREPGRCVVIDAAGDPAAVHATIWQKVTRRLAVPQA
jgi:dTMP kinase